MTTTVSALDVYSAYPHSDLIDIVPPVRGMSAKQFLKTIDQGLFGDTLFLFILREVADMDGEREEVVRALCRARDDLTAVIEASKDQPFICPRCGSPLDGQGHCIAAVCSYEG